MCNADKLKTKRPIYLTLLNGAGYVFDAEDYMELRRQHRIVGAMVGTCCTRGWDPGENTLPAELSPCETQLLVEQGIAVLVSKQRSLLSAPDPGTIAEYQQRNEEQMVEQAKQKRAEKLRDCEFNMASILDGKRRKILKVENNGCFPDCAPSTDVMIDPAQILREVSAACAFDRSKALLEIPCAHSLTHTAEILRLPADNSLKYRVFRDFWSRGHFVTAGDTFGADFLIYPGDPLLFHASHIIILLPEPCVPSLELINKVRLSVTVNKICLFAYFVDGEEGEDGETQQLIHYQTLSWEGDAAELDDDDEDDNIDNNNSGDMDHKQENDEDYRDDS